MSESRAKFSDTKLRPGSRQNVFSFRFRI